MDTKTLINNALAALGLVALALLVYFGKVQPEALVAYLGGLALRPGVSPPSGQA